MVEADPPNCGGGLTTPHTPSPAHPYSSGTPGCSRSAVSWIASAVNHHRTSCRRRPTARAGCIHSRDAAFAPLRLDCGLRPGLADSPSRGGSDLEACISRSSITPPLRGSRRSRAARRRLMRWGGGPPPPPLASQIFPTPRSDSIFYRGPDFALNWVPAPSGRPAGPLEQRRRPEVQGCLLGWIRFNSK